MFGQDPNEILSKDYPNDHFEKGIVQKTLEYLLSK